MTGKYNRKIKRGIVMPVQQFINREKSAGVVLGISIVVAMVLANSPWSEDYFHLFENKVGFFFNGEPYLYYSLHHWINDGLMSMFFFVVGLELKREFIGGELSDPRNTILPIGAAVAGMLVPALIYTLLNVGTGAAGGWGIPMATDIAFSLAIIYLLGDRVPLAAAGASRWLRTSLSRWPSFTCWATACRWPPRYSSPRWPLWTTWAPWW